jgi:hypothetical protein
MRLSLFIAAVLLSVAASATTTIIDRGPEPKVQVTRDHNLYDIFVTAPPKGSGYTPGSLSIYLSRDDATDFMRVAIASDRLADGRLHARINIAPETESVYYIYVYDKQENGKELLLLSKRLKDIR